MNILLTNDDGIHAPGLHALVQHLKPMHTLTVVAPDRERSAVGHGITLDRPIRAEKIVVNGGCKGFAVTGTPADCIKLAIVEILKIKPDLVVSGINPGANVGVNVNYSGTVAAAREAALYGIPSVAVSIQARVPKSYGEIAGYVRLLAEDVVKRGLPHGTFLNVNFPDAPLRRIAGIRISRQNNAMFSEYFEKRTDPRNRIYYWHGINAQPVSHDPDMDDDAIRNNYISITPIKCDMTDDTLLNDLRSWALSPTDETPFPSGDAS